MDRKGQTTMGQIGVFLSIFVAIIVGLALLGGFIIPTVGSSTTLAAHANNTLTMPASGSTVDLNGKFASGVIVTNATDGTVVPSNNYTILNNQLDTNGILTSRLQSDGGTFETLSINVSYLTQPLGYIPESGARGVALLIVIFGALAVAMVALVPVLKDNLLGALGR